MLIFQEIALRIEQVLDGISFDEPGISDKVWEQIELIHTQLKRAKKRSDSSDDDLFNGLMSVYNSSTNATSSDQDIPPGLSEKLQLVTISDLSQESLTLHEMAIRSDPAAVVEKMSVLLKKIKDQRGAAGTLRQVARRNAESRARIGDSGGIPVLVGLLSTTDVSTQEHVVTALLNVSIHDENKMRIISSGAIPGLLQVLERGSMVARENAAATLFSLSVVDECKVIIGDSGSIPPLVLMLSTGTKRGKKDAATALFNLCIYEGNKGIAVEAGLVPVLVETLKVTQDGTLDKALAILSLLSSNPEGKAAIIAADAIPSLCGVIKNESPRNKENAACILVHLCSGEQQQHLAEAQEQGVVPSLVELARSGTDRAKRKAIQLLEWYEENNGATRE